MLTKAGLELAQKLVHVENSMNESPPVDVRHSTSMSTAQKSKENYVAALQPSGNTISQNSFASQEVVEDFETRVPKPWLLCQEDTNAFRDSSITIKEKLAPEREVILPDNQLSLNSRATQPSNNFNNKISTLLSSDSMFPGNSVIHNSVQSDELIRYKHVMLWWSNMFILFQWEWSTVLVC